MFKNIYVQSFATNVNILPDISTLNKVMYRKICWFGT